MKVVEGGHTSEFPGLGQDKVSDYGQEISSALSFASACFSPSERMRKAP